MSRGLGDVYKRQVVVNADDLTESQIAQIEDIVKRKTECSADKIVISPVGKKK